FHVGADTGAGRLRVAHLEGRSPAGGDPAVHERGVPVVPDDIVVVCIRRGRAVVDPLHLLVGIRLAAGDGSVERPRRAAIGRPVRLYFQSVAVDPHRGGPRRAVGAPVDRRIGVEGVTAGQREIRLAPSDAAVGGEILALGAGA